MRPRYTADTRDPNESQVIDAFRAFGARVEVLHIPTDLLVAYQVATGRSETAWRQVLVEVKSPPGPKGGESAHGQKLSPAQQKFFDHWPEPLRAVVRSPEEARDLMMRL